MWKQPPNSHFTVLHQLENLNFSFLIVFPVSDQHIRNFVSAGDVFSTPSCSTGRTGPGSDGAIAPGAKVTPGSSGAKKMTQLFCI